MEESQAVQPPDSLVCGGQEKRDSAYCTNTVSIHVLESPQEIADFLLAVHLRELTDASVRIFREILAMIRCPVTVVCESEYVDEMYRDIWYRYYSGRHIQYQRNCKCLFFFQGELPRDLFFQYDSAGEAFLQSRFAGVCVLRPICSGEIGRTILDPDKLNLPECFLRTARFSFHVFGHLLFLNGFPFSSQDGETMSCAEITLWSILEYFGTRYTRYRTVLPGQIMEEIERLSVERMFPTRGLEYSYMTALFQTFGFSPRLYDRKAFGDQPKSLRQYRRAFHYYVESGIPLAVGISGRKGGEETRHSVVCVGHGCRRKSVHDAEVRYLGTDALYPYLDSSDLFDDYVIMDDNRTPYRVESYGRLEGWEKSEVRTFAVPLYQNVSLEASDASVIINTIFTNGSLGFLDFVEEMGEPPTQNNPLILRIFLADSGDYCGFRAKRAGNVPAAFFYSTLRLPRYIWVAEISLCSAYKEHKIYGEIVLDAASGRNSALESLLMIRYLNRVGFRNPEDEAVRTIDRGLCDQREELAFPYAMYEGNLRHCGNRERVEEI